MRSSGVIVAFGALSVVAQFPASQNLDSTSDLNTLANNSLYLRWRPQYHVLAPGGHMNDPCGPMYDPSTNLYHIFYQSFPQHVNFGNTSWSHATSPDLIDWTDVSNWENRSMVAIPTGHYPENDWIGAFSGGAYPVNLHGEQDGNLTLMYTGASKWPDNWQLPYMPQTEQQNIATSSDRGVTWQKYEGNPIIKYAPGGWNVTGFRDPVFAPDPALDEILKVSEPHYYLVAGSGIRDVGPRIPLYSAKASDLTKWTFLGALFELGTNYSFGGDETRTGNFNYNFELAGFYSLVEKKENGGDGKTRHWIVNMGSEGYNISTHPLNHYSLYAFGDVSRRANGSAELDIKSAGVLDWGNLYALNSFQDPKNDRRIIWGWSDEDLNGTALLPQGFQGSLGLPRETFIKKTYNVVAPAGENILQAPDLWTPNKGHKTYTVTSIAHRPAPDVVSGIQGINTYYGTLEVKNNIEYLHSINSSRFHIQVTIPSIPTDGNAGVIVRASPSMEEHTNITYHPANSSLVLTRSMSSLIPTVIKTTFVGYFAPFTTSSTPDSHSNLRTEPLALDIFVDGSLLEIFLNERFALTSRIYPSRADALGLALFSTGESNTTTTMNMNMNMPTVFEHVTVWEDLKPVWPHRPLNASSPLVFDKFYENHVTFETPWVQFGTEIYAGNKRGLSLW